MVRQIPKLKYKWDKVMPQPLPKWHVYQGHTNDCGPFCATIAANALHDDAVVDAPTLARAMEGAPQDMGRLLPSRVKGWATFPWGLVHALRSLGFQARWRVAASLDRLKNNVYEDRVTIVIVGDPFDFEDGEWRGWAHYKVLYAWDPESGFAFVDPASSEADVFSYQDAASFEHEWSWMGRIMIEVWTEDTT